MPLMVRAPRGDRPDQSPGACPRAACGDRERAGNCTPFHSTATIAGALTGPFHPTIEGVSPSPSSRDAEATYPPIQTDPVHPVGTTCQLTLSLSTQDGTYLQLSLNNTAFS